MGGARDDPAGMVGLQAIGADKVPLGQMHPARPHGGRQGAVGADQQHKIPGAGDLGQARRLRPCIWRSESAIDDPRPRRQTPRHGLRIRGPGRIGDEDQPGQGLCGRQAGS
jgi:hypothetical protein